MLLGGHPKSSDKYCLSASLLTKNFRRTYPKSTQNESVLHINTQFPPGREYSVLP